MKPKAHPHSVDCIHGFVALRGKGRLQPLKGASTSTSDMSPSARSASPSSTPFCAPEPRADALLRWTASQGQTLRTPSEAAAGMSPQCRRPAHETTLKSNLEAPLRAWRHLHGPPARNSEEHCHFLFSAGPQGSAEWLLYLRTLRAAEAMTTGWRTGCAGGIKILLLED